MAESEIYNCQEYILYLPNQSCVLSHVSSVALSAARVVRECCVCDSELVRLYTGGDDRHRAEVRLKSLKADLGHKSPSADRIKCIPDMEWPSNRHSRQGMTALVGSVNRRKKLFRVVEAEVRRAKICIRVSSSAPGRETADAWVNHVSIYLSVSGYQICVSLRMDLSAARCNC